MLLVLLGCKTITFYLHHFGYYKYEIIWCLWFLKENWSFFINLYLDHKHVLKLKEVVFKRQNSSTPQEPCITFNSINNLEIFYRLNFLAATISENKLTIHMETHLQVPTYTSLLAPLSLLYVVEILNQSATLHTRHSSYHSNFYLIHHAPFQSNVWKGSYKKQEWFVATTTNHLQSPTNLLI